MTVDLTDRPIELSFDEAVLQQLADAAPYFLIWTLVFIYFGVKLRPFLRDL